MTPDLWRKVSGHVAALLPLTEEERWSRLAELRQSDPEAAAAVESLLAGRTTPHAGGPVPPVVERQVGRYEVVDQLGRGGMGAVYRVRDPRFRRTLALKVLAPECAGDAALRDRFVEEAQLMGQLQHPGIPPVHDLGHDADGQPYFTMKLIRGETLRKQLQARSGPRDEQPRFLGVFEQVCATLAYVHSQGVIHRDLKPDNVMVGAFGEVQVMDWGLGRVLAAPEARPRGESVVTTARSESPELATRAGQVLGTPSYMAPEQARGEVDSLDGRCDVFALGAMLCEILTGEPPFTGWDVHDVMRQARRGAVEPALARLRKSGADDELVRLASRCLAAAPSERPASADAVHREMAGYLAGVQERLRQAALDRQAAEVRAVEERKRRRVATGLGGLVGGLALVLAAAAALLVVTNRQERQARGRAEEAEADAVAQFEQARKAVDECYGFAKEHQLLQAENLRKVKQLLLERTLPFYEQFTSREPGDDRLAAQQAEYVFRVGYIAAEIGSRERAERSYEQARDIYARLSKAHPEDETYLAELARCWNNIGLVQRETGRREDAIRSHETARDLDRKLCEARPGSGEYQESLATTWMNLALVHSEVGEPREAEAAFAEALAAATRACEARPEAAKYQGKRAAILGRLAVFQALQEKRADSVRNLMLARDLYQALREKHPEVHAHQLGLAEALDNLGSHCVQTGDVRAARDHYQQALALRSRLSETYPEMTDYQLAAAVSAANLGDFENQAGDVKGALRNYDQAISILRRLHEAYPAVNRYAAELARVWLGVGVLHYNAKNPKEARPAYERSRGLVEALHQANPAVTRYQENLGLACSNLGLVHVALNNPAEAVKDYTRAIGHLAPLAEANPDQPRLQSALAVAHLNLGLLRAQANNAEAAEASYRAALAIQQRLARAHPKSLEYQEELAQTWANLAVAQGGRDLDAAITSLQESLAIRSRLVDLAPDVTRYPVLAAAAMVKLGEWQLLRPAQQARALASADRALGLLTGALRRAPQDRQARYFLLHARLVRAQALGEVGRHEEAVAAAEEAARSPGLEAPNAYNLACVVALAAAAVAKDAGRPLAVREMLADRWGRTAVGLLGRAKDAGFFRQPGNRAHLDKDPDLAVLRDRDDYREFLRTLEAR